MVQCVRIACATVRYRDAHVNYHYRVRMRLCVCVFRAHACASVEPSEVQAVRIGGQLVPGRLLRYPKEQGPFGLAEPLVRVRENVGMSGH